jgi:hypothetical protein
MFVSFRDGVVVICSKGRMVLGCDMFKRDMFRRDMFRRDMFRREICSKEREASVPP